MKIESCTVFIRSTPSFFELTYLTLQNNCKNNGVINGLKQKKEKKHAKQLYMVQEKKRKRRGGE